MLKTAEKTLMDPNMSFILRTIGDGVGGREKTLKEGLVEIPHFSPEYAFKIEPHTYDFREDEEFVSLYGVSDTPEQALEYAQKHLGESDTPYCVFVTHIIKDPSNKGQGGGWRWHKWGEYIGEGKPRCEYLDDEEGFENGVYVFNIHKVLE